MKWDHAIVLGGGFAGMLAAHMLSKYFRQVTVIERDALTEGATRNGLPQAAHLHVLMQQGQQLLEKLMPGIFAELQQQPLEQIDWAQDTKWYGPFGVYPQYPSDVKTFTFSRNWLDRVLIQRVRSLKNVTLLHGQVVHLNNNHGHMEAVEWIDNLNQQSSLKGDLIVDARGRSANTTQFFQQLEYPVPSPRIVETELGYASRIYQWQDKKKAGMISGRFICR